MYSLSIFALFHFFKPLRKLVVLTRVNFFKFEIANEENEHIYYKSHISFSNYRKIYNETKLNLDNITENGIFNHQIAWY